VNALAVARNLIPQPEGLGRSSFPPVPNLCHLCNLWFVSVTLHRSRRVNRTPKALPLNSPNTSVSSVPSVSSVRAPSVFAKMRNPFPELVKTPGVSPAKQRVACVFFRAKLPGAGVSASAEALPRLAK
jgi:hypothetical protein